MTIRPELIAKLREKRAKLTDNVSPEKLEKLHAKGLLSARERLNALFLEGTFQELGLHATHAATHFGMAGRDLPADGVIAGSGYVGHMQVASFCQDFSVVAGTLGKMQARKITRIMRHALKIGVPVVAFKDSGGARIQEGVDALSGYGDVFYANVLLSGVVPQIAVICGPCAGGAAYSPALMDFGSVGSHWFPSALAAAGPAMPSSSPTSARTSPGRKIPITTIPSPIAWTPTE